MFCKYFFSELGKNFQQQSYRSQYQLNVLFNNFVQKFFV